jgi:hypothetical protein
VSLMAPLALSEAFFTCQRSIVHSLAVMTYEHNSGDGSRFLRLNVLPFAGRPG